MLQSKEWTDWVTDDILKMKEFAVKDDFYILILADRKKWKFRREVDFWREDGTLVLSCRI